MKISIIIPVLNEESCIAESLGLFQAFRRKGHEVIVVDGGSEDQTVALAKPLSDHILISETGRARQMNAGAATAKGKILVFLHADTVINFDLEKTLAAHVEGQFWGCFKVKLSGKQVLFRLYEYFINLRTRVTGIVTGDQVMVVNGALFNAIGGFPEIPLMEDVAISRSLLKTGRPVIFTEMVITSSRRWEKYGIMRTMLRMWVLRLKYTFGVSPARLAEEYESPPDIPGSH